MRMRKVAFVLAACTLLAQTPAGMTGRWRSAETSKGGIGAMYEFRADGSMSFSPGAIVEMPYRVEGNQLILPPATTNGPEQKSTLVWLSDDRFTLDLGTASAEAFVRQGSRRDAQDKLLGEWLTSRDLNGQKVVERMIFSAGNKCLLLIPFTTQSGRYTVTNGSLRAVLGGAVGLEGPVTAANGTLTIQRSGGRVLKLLAY